MFDISKIENKQDFLEGIMVLKEGLVSSHLSDVYARLASSSWLMRFCEILSRKKNNKLFWTRAVEQRMLHKLIHAQVVDDLWYDEHLFTWSDTKEDFAYWEHTCYDIGRTYKREVNKQGRLYYDGD